MRDLTLGEIKMTIGGDWVTPPGDRSDVVVRAVSTDTRSMIVGDLFVALKGPNFDGAKFLAVAQDLGAAALITSSLPENFSAKVPVIVVPDTLTALGRIARLNASGLRGCIIGIGGSNGKTTTRELMTAILGSRFCVLQNPANENNLVGVPQTLLRMHERHDFAIVEMGTNAPGEVARLADVVRPKCAVLTSISEEHLEGLGSIEGVLNEEAALLTALPRDGIAIVNFDDPRCVRAAQRASCRVVSYGTDRRCELFASDIRMNEHGTHFLLNGRHEFTLPLFGKHNVHNALAAISAGWISGIDISDMQRVLMEVEPVLRRLNYHNFGGVGVLDDSYNANPASTCAALSVLANFECKGQRVAVLGDMLELGASSERLHLEVGAYLAGLRNVDLIVAVGREMQALGDIVEESFLAGRPGSVWRYRDAADAAADLLRELKPNDLVLVKGSHGMAMNRVTEAIRVKFAPVRSIKPLRPTLREMPVGDPLPSRIYHAVAKQAG
ncbi:MAG: UDP-N-acetylmuramoyl-tripeptide--D-alanyl-D-alanine ligase [Planctomycetes bacterium]|nr:UDP-N-acetylmuramoyl-tripeptide--D-alanyl-D-alanine ligase [Planctomycetota bacterium]